MQYIEAGMVFQPKRFPFGWQYKDEDFSVISVLLNHIEEHKIYLQERVDYWFQRAKENTFRPIWLNAGRKNNNGVIQPFWNQRIQILDGNHRIAAARKLNWKMIESFMPKSHCEFYRSTICQ